MNLLPILLLLSCTFAANTINVKNALSGSSILTVQAPIRASALKDHILAQDPGLQRMGIKLLRGLEELQDTDEISQSANVVLVTSGWKEIPNRIENAWAFLTAFGNVTCEGNEDDGGRAPEGLDHVKEIVAANNAFAALKSDGSVIAWGYEDLGGRAPEGIEHVKEVVATDGAFAALKSDGSIVAWASSPKDEEEVRLLLK